MAASAEPDPNGSPRNDLPPPGTSAGRAPVVGGQRVETDAGRMHAAGGRLAAALAGSDVAPAFRFEPRTAD